MFETWDDIRTPVLAKTVALESDDSLRERVLYVAADGPALTQRIMHAKGEQLDWIAESYSLKRRKIG